MRDRRQTADGRNQRTLPHVAGQGRGKKRLTCVRPEWPSCNSHDRQVVVTVLEMIGEVRRTGKIMSALRASIIQLHANPRPDGRGYYISVLRT